MKVQAFAVVLFASLFVCATCVHPDKIEPFPQPIPTCATQKLALKYKPLLYTSMVVCVPYAAVDADGEVSDGLKGSNGNDGCTYARHGSQIYGRIGSYENLSAIMYAWYFPKRFWLGFPIQRHDWKSVVVWLNDLKSMTPTIVAVSMAKSDTRYKTVTKLDLNDFARLQVGSNVVISNTSLRFEYFEFGLRSSNIRLTGHNGQYQKLILWDQLTDPARDALNEDSNFGSAVVPFNDNQFKDHLQEAYPLEKV
ncbi:NLP-like protein [Plasmopara halstedii]|uniref:NLP-like protein n=1 Tax=Plasmopara halstedii TaxID=4781 RepID=A0A0N7L6P9_PLAHL|nr:NLP-like protein [Plasmopara halstedii]CEG44883.1 NLP-like protein [Plasmopara halstedii]|eukprot:XP_024581252.1 NLP-like protein [Plasmopara halstedii]